MSPSCCSCQSPAGNPAISWRWEESQLTLLSLVKPPFASLKSKQPLGCVYWLLSSPQRVDSAVNRSRQVTVTWWWKAPVPVPCSHRQCSLQPSTKKRQQTLPGKLASRAEELFYCSVNGAGRFLCSHIQHVSDEFLQLSTLLADNCRFMPWSLVHTVSLLLSNVTRLPKQPPKKNPSARIYFTGKIHSLLYNNSIICF